jgi:hypothetical protein
MRKTLTVLGLLFLLASTVAAQAKGKSWLRGSWEGTGYETDDNSTWPMQLTVKSIKGGRHAFSIDYPSLNCGGRWQLLSIDQSKARFREVLDHGQDKCSDKGLVTIERKGGQLVFLYSNQGSRELTASALLNRKRPASQR